MCGFTAQLVEHRTSVVEVMGSNPIEALMFLRRLPFNCLNWKIYCDNYSSLSYFHLCISFMPVHYIHWPALCYLGCIIVRTNFGKHFLLVGLYVSSIKAGTRHIIFLGKLSSIVRHSSRTSEDSLSRSIMCPVPVLIQETYSPANNKCMPKFVQTDNASSSIKTAIYL